MTTIAKELNNPPVSEVICGLRFKPLQLFTTPHVGILWQKYQPKYPLYREMGPIAAELGISVSTEPVLPRIWFVSKDETSVVQVQKDRLIVNWRKVENAQRYPGFDSVLDSFKRNFNTFTQFIKASHLGVIEPLEFELGYMNAIPKGQGWQSWSDLSQLLPSIGGKWPAEIGSPLGINLTTSCLLPEKHCLLQAFFTSMKQVRDDQEVLQIMLSAKTAGVDQSLDNLDMYEWFKTARTSLVTAFMSLTSAKVQKEFWSECEAPPKKKIHRQ